MADKQTYTFSNDITTVEVSSLGAKIVVIPQDRADIYVEYDNPKDSPEFCAVLSGKTLTLKESFSFSIFGSKPAEGYTITVYLPLSAYFNDVKLQSASGSIKLTNPLADKEKQEQTVSLDKEETAPAKYVSKSVSVCTVSGNAVVSGYRAEEFGIHSVSGTTTVDGISGKGSISVTSGTVNVSYAEWNGDLNVSLISGNVNVSLPEDSGVNLSVSGVSGMVKTDLGQEKGNFINLGKGTSGEFGGANKHQLTASLTSGTVTIARQ